MQVLRYGLIIMTLAADVMKELLLATTRTAVAGYATWMFRRTSYGQCLVRRPADVVAGPGG